MLQILQIDMKFLCILFIHKYNLYTVLGYTCRVYTIINIYIIQLYISSTQPKNVKVKVRFFNLCSWLKLFFDKLYGKLIFKKWLIDVLLRLSRRYTLLTIYTQVKYTDILQHYTDTVLLVYIFLKYCNKYVVICE